MLICLVRSHAAVAALLTACLLSDAVLATQPSPVSEQDGAGLPASVFTELSRSFDQEQLPLLKQFCLDCHSTSEMQGELDLETFNSFDAVRRHPAVWQKVVEMIDNGEMPPKDSAQLSVRDRKQFRNWVQEFLNAEALASAGDPGPVVLRRLNNAEFTYTIQDLTGVPLEPAREFPVDSASGEGFTNTGSSLVMSPAMITKYLDAAREISSHAVLLPQGFRFSKFHTRRDFTNEMLDQIRSFYARYTDSSGGDQVNLQGIVFNTNGGGRLPLEKYLTALLENRAGLRAGSVTFEQIALASANNSPQLSARYLQTLWESLEDADRPDSLLLNNLRAAWHHDSPEARSEILQQVARWQSALWQFTTVGHIGKVNGPTSWLEPVSPIVSRQDIRLPLSALAAAQLAPGESGQREISLYLVAGDAGTSSSGDVVVWERPRLVAAGRPDLLLRDVRDVTRELAAHRQQLFSTAERCLAAASRASETSQTTDIHALAKEFSVDAASLTAWLDYMGIGSAGPVRLGTPIGRKMENGAGYAFISGWHEDDALSIVANSSDQHVRIPGNMKPHSIAVHPAPTLSVVVGWKSPVTGTLNIEGAVQHAHPECGNGTAWTIELRRGNTRQRLAAGISHGATVIPYGPLEDIAVRQNDVVCLIISPRDGNHSCDLTSIDMTLNSSLPDGTTLQWNMASDLSPDLLAGNPHADQHGHLDVWHFFSEPATGSTGHVIPAGSLLAKWQSEADSIKRSLLAAQLQNLLQNGPQNAPGDSPDAILYQQLTSLSGPLMSSALQMISVRERSTGSSSANGVNADEGLEGLPWGLDRSKFGAHPADNGLSQDLPAVESASLCVAAPSVLEVRLPAD
ncbi:MAG: DUF1587 domain-containing protein, partial [Planctomycetaceae bacterium]|nr:DUF1587 domain-containing protein [Planctomycetaceae bacterium]